MENKQPALRLKGYSSISILEDVFSSRMVDIAYIGFASEEYAIVFPDDQESTNLGCEKDREWLITVVKETMKMMGENNVEIEFVPSSI